MQWPQLIKPAPIMVLGLLVLGLSFQNCSQVSFNSQGGDGAPSESGSGDGGGIVYEPPVPLADCSRDNLSSCLFISDTFDRPTAQLSNATFGWRTVIDDNGGTGQNILAAIRVTDEAPHNVAVAAHENHALYMTGRAGNSVHHIYLISKPVDLSPYNVVDFDFRALPINLEMTQDGRKEHLRLEVCTKSEADCGLVGDPTTAANRTRLKDTTAWVSYYSQEANQPINSQLNGRNHGAQDWQNILATAPLSQVLDKHKFIFRFSVLIDEGYNTDNSIEDSVALDLVKVRAVK